MAFFERVFDMKIATWNNSTELKSNQNSSTHESSGIDFKVVCSEEF
jgi:hypothetical protein